MKMSSPFFCDKDCTVTSERLEQFAKLLRKLKQSIKAPYNIKSMAFPAQAALLFLFKEIRYQIDEKQTHLKVNPRADVAQLKHLHGESISVPRSLELKQKISHDSSHCLLCSNYKYMDLLETTIRLVYSQRASTSLLQVQTMVVLT